MGSSYCAALYGKYLLQGLADVDSEAWLASEFIHYPSPLAKGDLAVAISQSGESVESVKAVRFLKKKHCTVLCITNKAESTMAKLSDRLLLTHAGEERASATKTFVSALALLHHLAVSTATINQRMTETKGALFPARLLHCAATMKERLHSWERVAMPWGRVLARSRAAVILGRGYDLPAALQGALLVKEVSKIPAEGMTGGEFMHGPLEMTSPQLFTVALAGGRTSSLMRRLALSIRGLGGKVLMLTPQQVGDINSIRFDETDETLTLFPSIVLLELLAYFAALEKHLNPDRFRFISKVTRSE